MAAGSVGTPVQDEGCERRREAIATRKIARTKSANAAQSADTDDKDVKATERTDADGREEGKSKVSHFAGQTVHMICQTLMAEIGELALSCGRLQAACKDIVGICKGGSGG